MQRIEVNGLVYEFEDDMALMSLLDENADRVYEGIVAEKAPPNDPLTLEELREMAQRCEGIYVAHTDGSPVFRDQTYCAAVLDFQPAFGSLSMHIQAIYGERLTLWEDEYGDTWLAYRRKPEGNV